MRREVALALFWSSLLTGILAVLIVVGSRNLAHFDAARVAYAFAALFAVFGITYRYAIWLQRPPTALYWKRGWQVFFRRRHPAQCGPVVQTRHRRIRLQQFHLAS